MPFIPTSLRAFILLSASSVVRAAIGPVTDLTLTSANVSPDGAGFERDAIVFTQSNTVIGPLITGNKGDAFQLNVVNNLANANMRQSTSIHWHGILQDGGSNWADGPAFVTQCPIAPSNSFLYSFQEPNQAGTFWYHSHLSTQYCDGARGPFVIYDTADPHASLYDVDDESTVITLADWYHQYAEQIVIGASDSTLINGLGRYAGTGGTASELSVVTVEQGKRYRLRFINVACDPYFTVSIDGHTALTIIEADGVNTVEVPTDSFDIFAGQRYSVILNANQSIGNYWIRAAPNGVSTFQGGVDSAILRYVGATEDEPTTSKDTVTNKLTEQKLIPLENPGAPGTHTRGSADVVHTLTMAFVGAQRTFTIDGASFTPPTIPVLTQILSGSLTAQQLLPAGSFIEINQGDIVEINLPVANVARVGGPHPFHLHGHTFDVIRSAGSTTDNYDNPPRRDVVSTGTATTDNVTIRFRADNPFGGPWFLHCHIDWHLELGFAIVFAESTDQIASAVTPTSSQWDQLCTTYDALDASLQ
ncbi:laccase [Flagelloscypha sp. PMI_526]|nr:laccase [Flagelloscypha sp. PMI_526]